MCRALMMGLMLHANAKSLIKKENYKDALDVLTMSEVRFYAIYFKRINIVRIVSVNFSNDLTSIFVSFIHRRLFLYVIKSSYR
jgi:hypothetical protein